MVVTDLRPNLIKITPSQVDATGVPLDQDIRRIIAEDSQWSINIVPLLKDLTINSIVRDFASHPILNDLNPIDRTNVLGKIATTIPLKVTAHLIHEESYWKKCCKSKFKICDIVMHGGSWKRMYFEKYLESVIENYIPEQTDPAEVQEALEICALYVKRLDITQLLPPSKEPKAKDNFSESAMSLTSEMPITDHFNFSGFLEHIPNLEEFHVKYGVSDCGMNFEWSLFQFTMNDCNSLAAAISKCKKLQVFSLHQSKVDDQKVRIIIKSLLKHHKLTEIDLSHNCISDRGAKAVAKLINNQCKNLKKVTLRNNIIRVEGAKALAYALTHGNKLEELDLRLNRVEDEGGQAIMRALVKNNTLKSIRLASNDLSERTTAIFAEALQENTTLTAVDLSGNRIGPDGGKAIQEGIEGNKTLLHLDLRLTDAGQESEYCIHQQLKSNRERARRIHNTSLHVPL